MEDRDRMTLRQLVQYHRMSAVLEVLSDIAEEKSLELRKLRDAEETASDARSYRRHARTWERVANGLHGCVELLRRRRLR